MAEIILGLDPGIATTGYGLIEARGSEVIHIHHGCILTPKDLSAEKRLVMIVDQLTDLIKEHKPTMVAIEELFFATNVTTAIGVAQARGAMIATIARFELPIGSYTPLQVKQGVTGDGRADKQQVQKMIKMILSLAETPHPDDAADALAIAITHANSYQLANRILS